MMLSSVKLTRTLPALKESLDWLPVDIAATALREGVAGIGGSGEEVDVLHVLNENRVPEWPDLLAWLRKKETFTTVSPGKWVKRLEEAQENDGADHPALKLLDIWKKAYLNDNIQDEGQEAAASGRSFDLIRTKRLIPSMRDIKPVDEDYFLKVWYWIDANM